MFFDRSAPSLEQTIRRHPEWREPLRRIVSVLGEVPQGGLIDPGVVARLARIGRLETLAYLDVLREAGLGDTVVRVVDAGGNEIGRFPNTSAVPARVENEFGDELIVMPENIDIAFEPHVTPTAATLVGAESRATPRA